MDQRWRAKIRDFWRDEEGAGAVEYALLVSGIAAFIAAAVYLFGSAVSQSLANSSGRLW
jgi:Flp pilus assembly pilin Flp